VFTATNKYSQVITGAFKYRKPCNRLEELGVVERVRRGLYRVIHDNIAKLLQLPVRNLSKPKGESYRRK